VSASHRFARRLDQMRPSTIREILKVTARPEIISFAGGLPAPELFPVEGIQAAADRVLATQGPAALQYGETEGYRPLREWLAAEMGRRGIDCSFENVITTSGSQQALDLVARAVIDPGDVVLTENPTYLAAIQCFQSYEARFQPVPTDEHGLIVDALPELIARHRPKLLYTIPNFQNPTGITLAPERRRALAELAAREGLLVVEDDPYGRLRYEGADVPPVKSFDTAGQVIYLSTFSKTVAPGLRVGWVVAAPEILARLVVLKQAADLHTSSLDQRIVHEYVATGASDSHIPLIRAAYGERYRAMDAALKDELPAGFTWTHPEGGMFLWVTGPADLDTSPLLSLALARQVAFVPGQDFFPDGSGRNYMRLNFSNASPERIREGVARLARLAREVI
jgi:2-aminoadipate transaminase